jgi:Tfp pilus assembly protein FimT
VRRRGATVFELLIAVLILAIVGSVVFRQFANLYSGMRVTSNMAASVQDARLAVDTLADHVRNAQLCESASAGTLNSAFSAISTTGFTYYADAACTTVRYALSGTNLQRTDSGVTTNVLTNVSSLTFTYYTATTYNSAWTLVTTPSLLTALQLPYVCGVKIDATVTRDGTSVRVVTFVRVRNAPKKIGLDGAS